MKLDPSYKEKLDRALSDSGLRSTRQREQVYGIIMGERDHPTADEIYARAKEAMPTISLATVYNCLETLVECGLVRQVNFERESSRFCPNLNEHAHFYCKKTGKVFDIDLPPKAVKELRAVLPAGFEMETFELSYRGETARSETGTGREA